MDPNQAIQKHTQWKLKFRRALLTNELMDADAVSNDNNCEVGEWLQGEARTLHGHLKAHALCLATHAAFHLEAGKAAVAANAGRNDETERMLANGSPFSKASDALSIALIQLKQEIYRPAPGWKNRDNAPTAKPELVCSAEFRRRSQLPGGRSDFTI